MSRPPLCCPCGHKVVPLLCLPSFDADPAHGELRLHLRATPRDHGLHSIPHVPPQGRSFQVHLQHHQVAQVSVQRDEEGEACVARDALGAVGGGGTKRRDTLDIPQWAGTFFCSDKLLLGCLMKVPVRALSYKRHEE